LTYVIGVVHGPDGAHLPGPAGGAAPATGPARNLPAWNLPVLSSALNEAAALGARKIIETLVVAGGLTRNRLRSVLKRADAVVPGMPLPVIESGRGENTVMCELRAIQRRASV
jgi:hypothetical protein